MEQWWYCSSGGTQQLRVTNEWSAGLNPTVLQKVLQVNSEIVTEGEGTEGNDKAQTDEE